MRWTPHLPADAEHAASVRPVAFPKPLPKAFHVMAKPSGAICNLDCAYCFFLSKELLYPGARFRMADDLLRLYIQQLIAAHAGAAEVTFAWQGGEPTTMGLEFFERVIALQHEYVRPGQRVINTLQTNGTLLTDAWGAFLQVHDVLVGISIDGPRDVHDRYRVDKGGKPTFDRVMAGLDVLVRHGVRWNVLTTVHAANGDRGRDVYVFLRDVLGATFVQFIPIVERGTDETLPLVERGWGGNADGSPLYTQAGTLVTDRSIGPAQYGRFLVDVFEEWVRRDVGTVYVQPFDDALGRWCDEPGGMCVHSSTCGTNVALEHNGDVYSCDHYVEPAYLLGNIRQLPILDLVASAPQRKFGQDKLDTLTRYCLAGDVRFACHGGCPKDRFATSPEGEANQHYLCASYQLFFRHVREPMEEMAMLLQTNRAPAELMAAYGAEDAGRDGHDPCSCGNGAPWAECHGRPLTTWGVTA